MLTAIAANCRVCFVTLVGLVLRIHPEDLEKDPLSEGFGWSKSLYGDLLLIILLLSLLPLVFTLVYQSPTEKALVLLQKIASSEDIPLHWKLLAKCTKCVGARDKSEEILQRKSSAANLRANLKERAVEPGSRESDPELNLEPDHGSTSGSDSEPEPKPEPEPERMPEPDPDVEPSPKPEDASESVKAAHEAQHSRVQSLRAAPNADEQQLELEVGPISWRSIRSMV